METNTTTENVTLG
nr:unnamed protein product [Callosobruchus chinensis]